MRVWAGIVRVSFVGDRAKTGRFHADQEQVDDLERAIASMPGARLEILAPELDVSGGLPLEQRPSLLAAVEGVEQGRYAGIIVSYLSRLGRNVREQLRAWDRVEAAGGRIIVVREGIDTSTASGRLQRNILLSIAEHEREAHGERFEERRRLATAAGVWQRRQTPRGYSKDPRTRRLVADEHADRVRQAFRDRAAGRSMVKLADDLSMTPSGVRALLANRVYLGELRVGRHVNPQAHEPLVTVAEFEAAGRRRPRASRSTLEPALLAGLLRCASCGHIMTRSSALAYGCVTYHSGQRCHGPAHISLPRVEAYVEALALRELGKITGRASQGDSGLADVQQQRARAERELAAYLQAVSAADVGAQAFQEGAVQRRNAVDEAIDHETRLLAAQTNVLPLGGDFTRLWRSADTMERNHLLRALFDAVVVRRAGGRGVRVPVADRVRVILAGGAPELRYRGAGRAMGVVPIAFDDLDAPVDPGMPGTQDL